MIVMSTVRCNREGKLGFVTDPRRLNVAISRPRRCVHPLLFCAVQAFAFVHRLCRGYIEALTMLRTFATTTVLVYQLD